MTRGKPQRNRIERGDGMHCLLCQNAVEKGVLSFCGIVMCGECEADLMEMTVEQPEYEQIIRALKVLWQRQFSAALDHRPLESDLT